MVCIPLYNPPTRFHNAQTPTITHHHSLHHPPPLPRAQPTTITTPCTAKRCGGMVACHCSTQATQCHFHTCGQQQDRHGIGQGGSCSSSRAPGAGCICDGGGKCGEIGVCASICEVGGVEGGWEVWKDEGVGCAGGGVGGVCCKRERLLVCACVQHTIHILFNTTIPHTSTATFSLTHPHTSHTHPSHREMSSFSSKHYDAAATLAARRLPVESAMPGTTLGVIPMETFAAGGTLYGACCEGVGGVVGCVMCVCVCAGAGPCMVRGVRGCGGWLGV